MASERQGDTDKADNPLRDLADIINHRVARHPRPQPELSDRRGNYREPPTPPGLDLAAVSLADQIRRDPDVISQVYETARLTATDVAQPWTRDTVNPDVATAFEILNYLNTARPTVHRQLATQITRTADRIRRDAYASMTRTRLQCPHCGKATVVPKPDLSALICIDYQCAPHAPRVIDPSAIAPADRRYSAQDLALMWNESAAAVRKRLWRAEVAPIDKHPKTGQHVYRWGDVAAYAPTGPAPTPPVVAPAPAARPQAQGGSVAAAA